MKEKYLCEICGEPMPENEQMFKYHGYSSKCPKPPLKKENGNNAGKWHVIGTEIIDQNGYIIAECDLSEKVTIGNKKANAKLIAAAPELLEALKSITEYWDTANNDNLSLHDHVRHSLKLAESAINKATK